MEQESIIFRTLRWSAGGFFASLPMAIAMEGMFRLLPPEEKYHLPPREISMQIAERLGQRRKMDEEEKRVFTSAGHFVYGAFSGGLLGLLLDGVARGPVRKGILMAAVLWPVSYLGWLPALGILKPATQHPLRRSILMFVAHLVYGILASFVASTLKPKSGNGGL